MKALSILGVTATLISIILAFAGAVHSQEQRTYLGTFSKATDLYQAVLRHLLGLIKCHPPEDVLRQLAKDAFSAVRDAAMGAGLSSVSDLDNLDLKTTVESIQFPRFAFNTSGSRFVRKERGRYIHIGGLLDWDGKDLYSCRLIAGIRCSYEYVPTDLPTLASHEILHSLTTLTDNLGEELLSKRHAMYIDYKPVSEWFKAASLRDLKERDLVLCKGGFQQYCNMDDRIFQTDAGENWNDYFLKPVPYRLYVHNPLRAVWDDTAELKKQYGGGQNFGLATNVAKLRKSLAAMLDWKDGQGRNHLLKIYHPFQTRCLVEVPAELEYTPTIVIRPKLYRSIFSFGLANAVSANTGNRTFKTSQFYIRGTADARYSLALRGAPTVTVSLAQAKDFLSSLEYLQTMADKLDKGYTLRALLESAERKNSLEAQQMRIDMKLLEQHCKMPFDESDVNQVLLGNCSSSSSSRCASIPADTRLRMMAAAAGMDEESVLRLSNSTSLVATQLVDTVRAVSLDPVAQSILSKYSSYLDLEAQQLDRKSSQQSGVSDLAILASIFFREVVVQKIQSASQTVLDSLFTCKQKEHAVYIAGPLLRKDEDGEALGSISKQKMLPNVYQAKFQDAIGATWTVLTPSITFTSSSGKQSDSHEHAALLLHHNPHKGVAVVVPSCSSVSMISEQPGDLNGCQTNWPGQGDEKLDVPTEWEVKMALEAMFLSLREMTSNDTYNRTDIGAYLDSLAEYREIHRRVNFHQESLRNLDDLDQILTQSSGGNSQQHDRTPFSNRGVIRRRRQAEGFKFELMQKIYEWNSRTIDADIKNLEASVAKNELVVKDLVLDAFQTDMEGSEKGKWFLKDLRSDIPGLQWGADIPNQMQAACMKGYWRATVESPDARTGQTSGNSVLGDDTLTKTQAFIFEELSAIKIQLAAKAQGMDWVRYEGDGIGTLPDGSKTPEFADLVFVDASTKKVHMYQMKSTIHLDRISGQYQLNSDGIIQFYKKHSGKQPNIASIVQLVTPGDTVLSYDIYHHEKSGKTFKTLSAAQQHVASLGGSWENDITITKATDTGIMTVGKLKIPAPKSKNMQDMVKRAHAILMRSSGNKLKFRLHLDAREKVLKELQAKQLELHRAKKAAEQKGNAFAKSKIQGLQERSKGILKKLLERAAGAREHGKKLASKMVESRATELQQKSKLAAAETPEGKKSWTTKKAAVASLFQRVFIDAMTSMAGSIERNHDAYQRGNITLNDFILRVLADTGKETGIGLGIAVGVEGVSRGLIIGSNVLLASSKETAKKAAAAVAGRTLGNAAIVGSRAATAKACLAVAGRTLGNAIGPAVVLGSIAIETHHIIDQYNSKKITPGERDKLLGRMTVKNALLLGVTVLSIAIKSLSVGLVVGVFASIAIVLGDMFLGPQIWTALLGDDTQAVYDKALAETLDKAYALFDLTDRCTQEELDAAYRVAVVRYDPQWSVPNKGKEERNAVVTKAIVNAYALINHHRGGEREPRKQERAKTRRSLFSSLSTNQFNRPQVNEAPQLYGQLLGMTASMGPRTPAKPRRMSSCELFDLPPNCSMDDVRRTAFGSGGKGGAHGRHSSSMAPDEDNLLLMLQHAATAG